MSSELVAFVIGFVLGGIAMLAGIAYVLGSMRYR